MAGEIFLENGEITFGDEAVVEQEEVSEESNEEIEPEPEEESVEKEDSNEEDTEAATEETGNSDEEDEQADAGKKLEPYTAEEMRNLDWEEIDSKRIPAEMQPWFKSMQASYTKKTMKIKEDASKLSENVNNIVSDIQSRAAKGLNADERKGVLAVTLQRLKHEFGEDADELDPAYRLREGEIYSEEANKYSEHKKRVGEHSEIEKLLKSREPRYAEIDKLMSEGFKKLPYERALEIKEGVSKGNYDPYLEYFAEVKAQLYGTEKKSESVKPEQKQQQAQAKRPVPPTVEGGGSGFSTKPKSTAIPEDFSRMSTEEQAAVLIKAGVVGR